MEFTVHFKSLEQILLSEWRTVAMIRWKLIFTTLPIQLLPFPAQSVL